ncbi:hypothetical protein [Eudoraea sp.]|uniref:hypothetical protein n=1 Tax=Eudoraea sp. TaxID=1979955 RepID=UPI003C78E99D
MKQVFKPITILFILGVIANCTKEKPLKRIISEYKVVQAAIKGEKSKGQQLIYKNSEKDIRNAKAYIKGTHPNFWSLKSYLPREVLTGEVIELIVTFQPETDFIGISTDTLVLNFDQEEEIVYELRGLSTKALEGENEPPLADVVETLGYNINLGWTSLANNLDPVLQGDELPVSLFEKVGKGLVEMIPVARYSPPFSLPFGYYTIEADSIIKYEVGVLANSDVYPEHQTLFPALESGKNSFDPGDTPFGFYTTSPSHDAFSEDQWNALWYAEHATHAVRIYNIKNSNGEIIQNQYLVCFEEAKNGDYQDCVFVLKNIEAISG